MARVQRRNRRREHILTRRNRDPVVLITQQDMAPASIQNQAVGNMEADKVTSGTFVGPTFKTAETGQRVVVDYNSNSILVYDTNGTLRMKIEKNRQTWYDSAGLEDTFFENQVSDFVVDTDLDVTFNYQTSRTISTSSMARAYNILNPNIQVGSVGPFSTGASTAQGTITFSSAFTGTPITMATIENRNNPANLAKISCHLYSPGLSSIGYYAWDEGGGNFPAGTYLTWLAIGQS